MTAPTATAVVPVLDGLGFLRLSLPPLLARVGIDLERVVVVDDGCRDGSAEYARALGADVLATAGRQGPAAARNLALERVDTELALFVDADVVVHEDTVARARAALAAPGLVAVFGSYDDRPPAPGVVSRWKNLQHHAVHQRGAGPASTFWSGCGAVRVDAFRAAGGFDVALFPVPSIEDIELGYRLRAAGGSILLDPRMQATHLKRWTAVDVVRTDVLRRALPWSRLLLRRAEARDDLNVRPGERARAVLAAATLAALPLAAAPLPFPCVPALLLGAAARANAPLLLLFARRHGLGFAAIGFLALQLQYVYAAGTYAYAVLERSAERLRAR